MLGYGSASASASSSSMHCCPDGMQLQLRAAGFLAGSDATAQQPPAADPAPPAAAAAAAGAAPSSAPGVDWSTPVNIDLRDGGGTRVVRLPCLVDSTPGVVGARFVAVRAQPVPWLPGSFSLHVTPSYVLHNQLPYEVQVRQQGCTFAQVGGWWAGLGAARWRGAGGGGMGGLGWEQHGGGGRGGGAAAALTS
jgi:hypothetical protein